MSNTNRHVLLISRDRALQAMVLAALAGCECCGEVLPETRQAPAKLAEGDWPLAIIDVANLPDQAGEQIRQLRDDDPDRTVLAIVAEGDVPTGVAACQAGARAVLARPVSADVLQAELTRLIPAHPVDLADDQGPGRIAGSSRALQKTVHLARRVAACSAPVLITGESGTGKELLSHLVHRASPRREQPYIRVNCAALSESLLESELFGHERGAFTGAHMQRKGRFELAHRGTLLLDEISETTPRLQAELLRVLEQQDFQRVGGTESIHVNVRVICTSNRDLAEQVGAGEFREDLYYRIAGIHLQVPPLRERLDDLETLVWHFVNLYAAETARAITALDEEMIERFGAYDWPGNIRQLRNVVRSALVLGDGEVLGLDEFGHLDAQLRQAGSKAQPEPLQFDSLSLDDVEREAVIAALQRTNQHQAKAAALLGISDRTLRDKIRRYRQDGHLEEEGQEPWPASRAS